VYPPQNPRKLPLCIAESAGQQWTDWDRLVDKAGQIKALRGTRADRLGHIEMGLPFIAHGAVPTPISRRISHFGQKSRAVSVA
jgi:hypothetical protein